MTKPRLIEIPEDLARCCLGDDISKPYVYHRDGHYYAEAQEWADYRRSQSTSGEQQ